MINLLLGAPGGGKSYEAAVFHILPAIMAGRKVITNLPVYSEEYERIEPFAKFLLKVVKPAKGNLKPFSTLVDYGDSWRHPENGCGPLYVIDECHTPLPKGGTRVDVEEWYAMHRHEYADVLLLTQSYNKISPAIRELVQTVYRVRKCTSLGSQTKYVRKVQDGLRGAVVNETIRSYQKKYFPLYRSHTKSSGLGQELAASDIKPIWKHWSIIGSALLLPVGISTLAMTSGNLLSPEVKQDKKPVSVQTPVNLHPVLEGKPAELIRPDPIPTPEVPKVEETVVDSSSEPEPEINHPYANRQMHIAGFLGNDDRWLYMISISQNGQEVSKLNSNQLKRVGYDVKQLGECAAQITWDDWSQYVICDAPSTGMKIPRAGA